MNEGPHSVLLPPLDSFRHGSSAQDQESEDYSSTTDGQPTPHPKRKLLWPWIWLIFAVGSLTITAIYASQYPLATRIRFVYDSSSNTIFILSALSMINGVLLNIIISQTFELVQWMLLVRPRGLHLPAFLALHPSTGVFGRLTLLFSLGLPIFSGTRVWSLARLICTVLVPVVGVLIMSQVNTQMTFDTAEYYIPAQGWGMTSFNGTLAKNVSLVADQIIQAQLDMFLQDTSRAVDITPVHLRTMPCLYSPTSTSSTPCEQSYFMAGVEFTPPVLDNGTGITEKQAILATGQQGYILDYKEAPGNMSFGDDECQVYGFPFAAFNLCLRNEAQNILNAQVVQCPPEITSDSDCFSNSAWHNRSGWRTLLTTNFRPATVGYSRLNGSIVSMQFTSPKVKPAPVGANDMLQAYRDAYGNFTTLTDIYALFADSSATDRFPIYAFPALVAMSLKSINTLELQNPAVQNKAAANLQCLLAIMIYYAQPSLFAKYLAQTDPKDDLELANFKKEILALALPDTITTVAVPRYQISVGKSTLVAYLILTALPLLICTIVLAFITISKRGKRIPRLTSFPYLDAAVRSRIVGDVERGFGNTPLQQEVLIGGGEALVKKASRIRLGIGQIRSFE